MLSRLIYIAILIFLFISCKKLKISKNERPGYLYISKGTLIEEGQTFREHVGAVWVYVYPEYYGSFTLPKKIPIIRKGFQRIFFQGAVFKNGGYLTPIQYPFWQFDSLETEIKSDSVVKITPIFKYYDDTLLVFPFYENFEDAVVNLEKYSPRADSIPIIPTDSIPYLGARCAIIRFDSSRKIFEVKSSNSFGFPRNEQIWMEIAVRGNQLLQAGLIEEKIDGTQIVYNYITLVPSEIKWTKVYVDITPLVYSLPSTSKFRLYLFSNSFGKPNRYIMIDDIKIIHFKP